MISRILLLTLALFAGSVNAESSIGTGSTKLTATAAINFRVVILPMIQINVPANGDETKIAATTNIPKQQVARTLTEELTMYASLDYAEYLPPIKIYTVAVP